MTGHSCAPDAAQRAGSRSRHQQAHGFLDGGLHAGDATRRLHQQEVALESGRLERVGELLQIVGYLGTDERIQRSGREALVFPELRQHLRAQRYIHFGELFLDDPLHHLLVTRIEEREQEAHRDRLDAVFLQLADRAAHLPLVDRMQYFARGWNQPFLYRQAVAPLHNRMRLPGYVLRDAEIERPFVPADMDDVPESLGGDHAGFHAIVLQHQIGRNRRAVEQVVDRFERRTRRKA